MAGPASGVNTIYANPDALVVIGKVQLINPG